MRLLIALAIIIVLTDCSPRPSKEGIIVETSSIYKLDSFTHQIWNQKKETFEDFGKSVYQHDDTGNTTEVIEYRFLYPGAPVKPQFKTQYGFLNGRLVERKHWIWGRESKWNFSFENLYQYDNNGLKTQEVYITTQNEQEYVSVQKFRYNDDQRVHVIESYPAYDAEDATRKTKYSYDDLGRLVRKDNYEEGLDEAMGDTKTFVYSGTQSIPSEVKWYYTTARIESNDKNQMTKYSLVNFDPSWDKEIIEIEYNYTYNNNGQLSALKGFTEHEEFINTYAYSEAGNLVLTTFSERKLRDGLVSAKGKMEYTYESEAGTFKWPQDDKGLSFSRNNNYSIGLSGLLSEYEVQLIPPFINMMNHFPSAMTHYEYDFQKEQYIPQNRYHSVISSLQY